MTRLRELAEAVLNDSARRGDAVELARLVLESLAGTTPAPCPSCGGGQWRKPDGSGYCACQSCEVGSS